MKKIYLFLSLLLTTFNMWAQPEPYPIDKSFIPGLSFLQKQWIGEYRGVDPRSKATLSISRDLLLQDDMTFVNVTYGGVIHNDICVDTLLLKYEQGTYEYDMDSQCIIYSIEHDSTLAMDAYLNKNSVVSYKVNTYTENSGYQTYNETTQFTSLDNGEKAWVMIDPKLGSDQKQGMPSVYLLKEKRLENSIAHPVVSSKSGNKYDLMGREVNQNATKKGIFILNGRKYLFR